MVHPGTQSFAEPFTDEQSPQAIWQIIVLTGVIGEGSVQSAFTASLNHLPGLKEATLRAGNSMESPVLGFLHVPAGRCFLEKVPNPGRVIVSPLPTASMMMSRAAFKAFPITCGGMLVAPDAAVMSSYFVIWLFSSKTALAGLFCGRNNLHRWMVAFLTGLPRGASALPTAECFLPPINLFKE